MVKKGEFKVGDKLRLVKVPNYLSNKYNVGDLFPVVSVYSGEFWLLGDKKNAVFAKDADCFELVERYCDSNAARDAARDAAWDAAWRDARCEETSKVECGNCSYCEINKINEPVNSSRNKVEKIMSNIIKFVKESFLSADEKLLRKVGLKDSCGDYSSEAEALITQKLLKDNEKYLVEVAKAMEAEEKANK